MKANSHASRLSHLIAVMLLVSTSWTSAAFVAPTDSAPFRRDQLPIDVETMKRLSNHLVVLCASLDVENNPKQQRTAAQYLALAQSLDPVNRETTDLLDTYSNEKSPNKPDTFQVSTAKTQAWRIQSWLASDESGNDGKALALCLGDVLAQVDPDHRAASAHKTELGKWNQWVAGLEEFKKNNEPEITELEIAQHNDLSSSAKEEEKKEAEPETGKEEPSHDREVAFVRDKGMITSPLWIYREQTQDYILKLTPVSLHTWINHDHEEFIYHVKGVDEEKIHRHLVAINKSTVPWLREKNRGLPRGGVVDLSMPGNEIYSIRRNGEAISAAAAVLASSSLTGHEPTGIVMGIVQRDGKLTMPKNAWELIQTLTTAPPSRVVMPKSAAETLKTLLVKNDLAFFMKHDIFFADNIDELIAFSKKTPDATVAASLSNFASIREKATSSIGPFVANPFVRGRLEAIVAATPQFASAECLLIQATGKRPSQLTDKMLAHQIRAALQPLQEIAKSFEQGEGYEVTSTKAQAAHDASRAALDPLDRLIASSERELYDQALDISNSTRTLARAIKKLSDNDYEDSSRAFHDKSMGESIRSLTVGLPEIERRIARVLGEPVEQPNQ